MRARAVDARSTFLIMDITSGMLSIVGERKRSHGISYKYNNSNVLSLNSINMLGMFTRDIYSIINEWY